MKYLIATVALLASSPAFAQDDAEIGGFRVEAHVGIERPSLNEKEDGTQYVAKLSSSLAYGLELGYDVPVSSNVTVGPYVSYDRGNSDKCESGTQQIGVNYQICFEAKSNLSAGVRVGYATGEKGEIYLGLGYDKYDYDYSEVYTRVPTNAVIARYTSNKANSGLGVSLGYNHKVSKKLYAGAGMKISELGDFENTSWSLQRVQLHATLGARF